MGTLEKEGSNYSQSNPATRIDCFENTGEFSIFPVEKY